MSIALASIMGTGSLKTSSFVGRP